MPTLPTNPHAVGDSGHVNDHNTIVTALAAGAFISGTNITNQAGTTKLALGAWTAYTPTWSGISSTGGTSTGRYAVIGKTVHFYAKYVMGSSSLSVTGAIVPSLPVAAVDISTAVINGIFDDINVGRYMALMVGTTAYVATSSGNYVNLSAPSNTVPMTWATGDNIIVAGTYEAS